MSPAVSEAATGSRLFPNRYGYFEAEGGTFVITDILTPRPWINVLANERYGVVVSQGGGGFSWADNCQIFRLSRWEQDLVRDDYGRFVYVLDLDKPEEVWSTTYQPTRRGAETDQVRHGLGSTEFTRRFLDLETKQTVFVPDEEQAEAWLVEVRNLSGRSRRLRLASYLEWHLGGIGDWHREFHRLFMESETHRDCLVAWKHPGLAEGRREITGSSGRAFVCWNGAARVRWITDKLAWLGPSGDIRDPVGLRTPPDPSKTPRWDDPIAAGVFDLELGPNETRTLSMVIGVSESTEGCLELGHKYGPTAAGEELARSHEGWLKRCAAGSPPPLEGGGRERAPIAAERGAVVVSGSASLAEGGSFGTDMRPPTSPLPQGEGEVAIDLMNRTWLPYQAIAGRLMARCAYYQQGGAYGYRDQLQDSLMLLDSEPQRTLEQLGRHAEAMYDDGAVRHWWHPGTDIFVESHHSDTCLWLAYGTLAYLDATGDYAALDREYVYLDRRTQKPGRRGTLWQHCLTGIDRALSKMSPRGLPLMGSGDWNDGLSHAGIEGKGESTWMAMFLFDILRRWRPHLDKLGMADVSNRFDMKCHELATAVNRFAWDGEWYTAGIRDDGLPIGGSECKEGRIFLNPQTWAVISGIAPSDRVVKAMQAVRKHLVTPYGALLLRPAFTRVDPYIGYISRYAPGLRENGGVYSHASTWAIQAFAMVGDKQTARSIYEGMMPPLRAAEDPDLYAAEPYVMPGNVDGPDSPYAGRAGWTWYTGSAAWMRRVVKWIE